MIGTALPASFFRRTALELAPDLLDLWLIHHSPRGMAGGPIVEVEAYMGPDDLAAHSARGHRSPRNEAMYHAGGIAYVYFIYGMHHCVNVVAAAADQPQAVLIRALEPRLGIDLMRQRRGSSPPEVALTRGPGNVCRALGIDRSLNGADLRRSALRLVRPAPSMARSRGEIAASARVGIDYAGEWTERPWRFSLLDHPSVSVAPGRERKRAAATAARPKLAISRSGSPARRPSRSSPK